MNRSNVLTAAIKLNDAAVYGELEAICGNLKLSDVLKYVEETNPSKDLPYHSNRHQFFVAVTAFRLYMVESIKDTPSWHDARALVMAGLFHDFNHSGGTEADSVNIQRASTAVMRCGAALSLAYALTEDAIALVHATEWPPTELRHHALQKYIQDADLLWTREISGAMTAIDGLPEEFQHRVGKVMTPTEMAAGQEQFFSTVKINSEAGAYIFSRSKTPMLQFQKEYAHDVSTKPAPAHSIDDAMRLAHEVDLELAD